MAVTLILINFVILIRSWKVNTVTEYEIYLEFFVVVRTRALGSLGDAGSSLAGMAVTGRAQKLV